MDKNVFILYDEFNKALSKEKFEKAKSAYLRTLEETNYSIKNSSNIYELIDNIKRTPEIVGPYRNISVFEALNRIGSDLVLISGAEILFSGDLIDIKPKSIHLKMGTTHGFDFEVFLEDGKVIYGEAFNAAKSFCKDKMRQAIHKLIDKNHDKNAQDVIVFINEDVKDLLEKYVNKKEIDSKMKVHRVYCGKIE